MSLCSGRLLNDTKSDSGSQDSSVNQTLDFLKEYAGCDFEEDGQDGQANCSRWSCNVSVDSGGHNLSGTSFSGTPRSSRLWDSGLGSPTPAGGATPGAGERRSPASADVSFPHLSPISFNFSCCEDDSDCEHPSVSNTDTGLRSPYNGTPPHKKFTSLRLYDTPHTPKSLLQKAQRRMSRARRSTRISSMKGRLSFDTDRPQTNINPFNPEEVRSSSVKRSHNVIDR